MATPAYSFPYQPYTQPTATPTAPQGYTSTTDPRKLAENQRLQIAQQGQQYQTADQQLANQYANQSSGTQAYLNPIEGNLAGGGGGYNPSEVSQIEYTPGDVNNIVQNAAITAGGQTAASVGAADRAAAAAGGNPAALATFRARAAQTGGNQAADAMTNARVAAKGAEAGGAEAVGGARMGQQQEGLNYFGGLQGQQQQTALAEQGLGQAAYGTQTSGTNAAADTGLKASQTPTAMDKIIGGVSGAVSALADGRTGGTFDYLADGRTEAVVGEDGPEMIIEGENPARHMDDGGQLPPAMNQPAMGTLPAQPGFGSQAKNILQNYLSSPSPAQTAPAAGQRPWSPVDTWSSAGKAVGSLARYLADGGDVPGLPQPPSAPKLITSPTRIKLDAGDQVVPLSHRPNAKIRPSAAIPAIHAMQRKRPMFGGRI